MRRSLLAASPLARSGDSLRSSSLLATCAVAAMLVLAGCSGTGTAGPAAGETTDGPLTTDPPTTETPTDDSSANDSVRYDAFVFDHAGADDPVIEGGITYPDDAHSEPTYFATIVGNASETDRFNWNALPADAAQFVNGTDFDSASILVVQAFPKSSVPDYRVENLARSGDALKLRLNDSSQAGTADITVETVLIRVHHDGTPPTTATVSTQTGASFETGEGRVTIAPPDDDDDSMYDVELPYASDDESENVDDPRDLTITNDGSEVNGYNVSVVAMVEPDCRDANPPCQAPAKRTAFVQEIGKLRPNESVTFENLIAKHGEYTIVVEADLPDGDSRRTVTETFQWRISESYGDAFVTIDDDSVEITQAAQ